MFDKIEKRGDCVLGALVHPSYRKSARPLFIILIYREATDKYVTAWAQASDSEWSSGNYFEDYDRALKDFKERACLA